MSEETQVKDHNDGTWSGLKKTIIGTITTAIAGGGVWLATFLGGGHKEEEKPVQAAQPSIIINNSQQQQQAAGGSKTVVIKEKEAVKPVPAPKKKDGDEFKEKPAQW